MSLRPCFVRLPGIPKLPVISAAHWDYRVGKRVIAMDYVTERRRRYRLGTVTAMNELRPDILEPRASSEIVVACDDGETVTVPASWLYMLDGMEPLALSGGQAIYDEVWW